MSMHHNTTHKETTTDIMKRSSLTKPISLLYTPHNSRPSLPNHLSYLLFHFWLHRIPKIRNLPLLIRRRFFLLVVDPLLLFNDYMRFNSVAVKFERFIVVVLVLLMFLFVVIISFLLFFLLRLLEFFGFCSSVSSADLLFFCLFAVPMGEKEQTVEAETAAERGPSSSSESSQDHVSVPVAAPSTALSARSSNGSRCGSKGQRTRLVVRDIEVENFKSYYGKHRIGPFHKTFTAVIGPNGSGKSNVIDSMLLVFGRNAKKIRLEKLSELIHSSAAHPNVSFSSVAVNFVRVLESEEDERCPEQRVEMSGSHFSIRREVFRTGASQYYVDDRRSTQKEVEKRLISEGIDLEHNRFLILQGEVEQIALMKPKGEKEGEEGLLEYLDDLIGTNSGGAADR
eukprot:gene10071-7041_t